jgi:uncharacterized protein YbjT (DUF2867 family)
VNGPILVTGGTGTLGRPLVRRLAAQGIDVRVLSRRPAPAEQDTAAQLAAPLGTAGQETSGGDAARQQTGRRGLVTWATGDLKTGRGIDAAVAGAEVIVHCATGLGDAAAARNLIDAARRAGRPHLVYISIVGIDRVPLGYYKSKLEVERQVEASGLSWTVLRATQFHQLILRGCEILSRLPVMLVPAATPLQPIDAADVAGRLAELAAAPAAGRVPDMGGPEVRRADELGRMYLDARGRRRALLPVRLPGAACAGLRRGELLARDHATGWITFAQFLAGRLGRAAGA